MSNKIALLGTGLSGLVGSKFVELFTSKYDFDNFDLTNPQRPIDITHPQQVATAITNSPAKFMVHMAAFTDVTGAWLQTGDKNGPCWQVNVVGTKNIVRACQKTGKHLIHISTAYVFDGIKTTPYLETDQPHPIEWYGQTKAEAESLVTSLDSPWTILRIDQPFRSDELSRPDVVGKIMAKLKAGSLPPQFTDHTFGPTYIDDFAQVLDWVIRTQATGIWHATSNETWTDFKFAQT
ncbi:sugar nucleotide-binding protein, partial [Patescibacteria group bacterium]|nr:sugar nucleotide-binding protein [Patescibacteria group bacterium]